MRLVLLISSLRSGGAERVASIAANYWAQKQWHVTVMTLSGRDEPPFYQLDPGVHLLPLGVASLSRNPVQGLASNIRRLQVIRREVTKAQPDAVISFMDSTNVLAVLATRGLRFPVVVADRNNPTKRRLGTAWRLLRNWAYRRAQAVVVQTERARQCFPEAIQDRCVVIPNPIRTPGNPSRESEYSVLGPAIVAMGRLSTQKGFDLLIDAFARVSSRHPQWHLVVVGEGPERGRLERQSSALGMDGRVHFPGRVRESESVLRQSKLFVLSSRYEGFPNVLCEAMACGLPVVSFDCPFGPAEIVRDCIDGVLVRDGDSVALSNILDRMMADEGERQRLAARAPEVLERFGVERIMGMWEGVLKCLTPRGNGRCQS